MSGLHPRIKVPLWVALALPGAAYVCRSMARGMDFRPDMPVDLIAFAVFAVGFGAAAWSRRMAAKARNEKPSDEEHREDDGT